MHTFLWNLVSNRDRSEHHSIEHRGNRFHPESVKDLKKSAVRVRGESGGALLEVSAEDLYREVSAEGVEIYRGLTGKGVRQEDCWV